VTFRVDAIDHVEVFVRDIENAARWYADVLGLEEEARWDPEPVFLAAGSSALALFRAKPDAPLQRPRDGCGWHRVAWATSKGGFESAQRHLSEKRIPFRGPIDHEIAWSIYFEDPDGNPLEITCEK